MPRESIISFHECYGSPLTDPTKNVWKIGNVEWTGVPLRYLLTIARPDVVRGLFVWSDGLGSGAFTGISADRYQKDLSMDKALSPEVLVAYEMNGKPLSTERGGPVRLVVPGWFGTNSTKWLCHLSVRERRSPSLFTTVLYNETDPTDSTGVRQRPVKPNSMIVRPRPEERFFGPGYVEVWGRAWGAQEIVRVDISVDHGRTWIEASVRPRRQFGWQLFCLHVFIHRCRAHVIQARAMDRSGVQQPLSKRRKPCTNGWDPYCT
jgi:DMSO/TMAO reductase YedYZ molybdopterin-dependent catalytic subunit